MSSITHHLSEQNVFQIEVTEESKHALFLQYICDDQNRVMYQILYTVCTFSNQLTVKISVLQPLNFISIEQ